jgi:hypothetical protein
MQISHQKINFILQTYENYVNVTYDLLFLKGRGYLCSTNIGVFVVNQFNSDVTGISEKGMGNVHNMQ